MHRSFVFAVLASMLLLQLHTLSHLASGSHADLGPSDCTLCEVQSHTPIQKNSVALFNFEPEFLLSFSFPELSVFTQEGCFLSFLPRGPPRNALS